MIERLPGNVQLVIGKLEIGWKSFLELQKPLDEARVLAKVCSQLIHTLTLAWTLGHRLRSIPSYFGDDSGPVTN